jgi:hypothetical protein
MTDSAVVVVLVYAIGVVVGLFAVDDTLRKRVVVAVLWPLGPLAFVIVITILILSLPIALPRVAAILALLVAASWIIYRAIV